VTSAAIADDGRNVVLHEFAHQLNQQSGYANGAPILVRRAHYQRWAQVLGDEFAKLREQAGRGELTLFSHYGATHPAEFFAVISEPFFDQPDPVAEGHPALYAEIPASIG